MLTQSEITTALHELGLRPAIPVLLHSSLRRFGQVDGGASAVIAAVLDVVGPRGTVLAPTLTGRKQDGPHSPPTFDRYETPCWTGTIPETLRQWPGAIRSIHGTHSVAAVGYLKDWIIRDHWRAETPCGLGTPYARLAAEGGQIILFGVDWNSCTTVHGLEETAGVPYHLQRNPTRMTLQDGDREITVERVLHDWNEGLTKDFNRLDPVVSAVGGVHRGRVGESLTTIIDAALLWSVGVAKLLADPWFLIEGGESTTRVEASHFQD